MQDVNATTFETLQRDHIEKTMHVLVAGLPCFEPNSWLSHRTWHNEAFVKTLHKWWRGLLTHMEFCNLRVTGFWVLGYLSPPLEWGNMAWSGCTGREGVPLFSDSGHILKRWFDRQIHGWWYVSHVCSHDRCNCHDRMWTWSHRIIHKPTLSIDQKAYIGSRYRGARHQARMTYWKLFQNWKNNNFRLQWHADWPKKNATIDIYKAGMAYIKG